MICPQCHLFTPDTGFKCIHCGAVCWKAGNKTRTEGYPQPQTVTTFFRPWLLLPLAMLAVLVYLFFAQQNKTRAINAFDPGGEFDIESHVQKGKITIFDFFSDYCPPCRQISPLLKKLDEQRPDLVVLAVDINRKGAKGIDFYSPLARQYRLNAVPHFKIFDAQGKLVSEGQQAYGEVIRLLYQAGIQ
jgi:thiol-disulfide isomerase/thioredoxin